MKHASNLKTISQSAVFVGAMGKSLMTKYYFQNRPDSPGQPDKPDDPDKPVEPRPFDPDPSPGDPIVDPADEPML